MLRTLVYRVNFSVAYIGVKLGADVSEGGHGTGEVDINFGARDSKDRVSEGRSWNHWRELLRRVMLSGRSGTRVLLGRRNSRRVVLNRGSVGWSYLWRDVQRCWCDHHGGSWHVVPFSGGLGLQG